MIDEFNRLEGEDEYDSGGVLLSGQEGERACVVCTCVWCVDVCLCGVYLCVDVCLCVVVCTLIVCLLYVHVCEVWVFVHMNHM